MDEEKKNIIIDTKLAEAQKKMRIWMFVSIACLLIALILVFVIFVLMSQKTKNKEEIKLTQKILIDVKKVVDNENGKARKGKGVLRQGSDMEKIRDIIRQTGRPMHISEIVTGLGRADTKADRVSISSSLSRYVRAGEVFKRVKPNTFALIDMDTLSEAEFPPDFGAEEITDNHPTNSLEI